MKLKLSNNLFKSSLIYTVINFINKVFPFLLLPLFTRELSMNDFGIYNLIKASIGIFIPLIGFNSSEAVIRKYYESSKEVLSEYIFSGLIFMLGLCLFFLVLVLMLPSSIFQDLFDIKSSFLLIAILISFFTAINNIERGLLRCEGNNRLFAVLVISQSVLYFSIAISLYFVGILNLRNILITELFSFCFFGICGIALLRKKYRFKMKVYFIHVKEIFTYSLPLVLNTILAYLFALSDRFLISNKLNNDSVALYAAAFQIVSVLQILAVSFNSAWVPYVFKKLGNFQLNITSFKKNISYIMFSFLLIGFVYYFVLKYSIVYILGEKYIGSEKLIGWMIFSNILQSFYWLATPIIKYYKKNWLLTFASLPAVIFSIVCNYLFLENEGIVFAAQVNAYSWVIMLTITFYMSYKMLHEAYKPNFK
ncbi:MULTISPECIES: lipopolysaccharide biosynthesis protein [unclassified Sphingobacterium]|uniref:lipopolysaccharide biosynthesis protein n=1 Tax=unclassified Sphingobacterium TaxID=2609468 RepID=UPI00104A2E2F|nr:MULTISPECIES: oligosaccharide flippase family protein [unclassified Sphingobacterium]MCS3555841.1 O-antigen/teichoic acid export membrane protein [Sphingobacterium sp. JUb21]TCR00706.1 O-antigen/teichoic acid export membrane protein [Sphingobacterium sp. JUb20]